MHPKGNPYSCTPLPLDLKKLTNLEMRTGIFRQSICDRPLLVPALPHMMGPPMITYPGAPSVMLHSGSQYPSFMMPFVFNHPMASSEGAPYAGVVYNTDKHLPPTPHFPLPPGGPSYIPFPSGDSASANGPPGPSQSRSADHATSRARHVHSGA